LSSGQDFRLFCTKLLKGCGKDSHTVSHRWGRSLGQYPPTEEVQQGEPLCCSTQVMNLSLLAPISQEALLAGEFLTANEGFVPSFVKRKATRFLRDPGPGKPDSHAYAATGGSGDFEGFVILRVWNRLGLP
jgi:hypothetical protein